MKSTDTKAKSGMMTFGLILLAAALITAGLYFFFLMPGQPDPNGLPHAGDETSEGGRS